MASKCKCDSCHTNNALNEVFGEQRLYNRRIKRARTCVGLKLVAAQGLAKLGKVEWSRAWLTRSP